MSRAIARTGPWPVAIAALGLLGLTVGLRLPFASRMLFAWDSANFALALDQYNVAFHQPHPPGYPLYVGIAKLINFWVLDANASYVAISIAASAGAVVALFLLGSRMYGAWVGFLAAVLMVASVGFWGYGEVAYPYTSLAFFSALIALLCYLMWQGHYSLAVLSGLLLGIAGGIRQDVLVFLGPLWLVSIWGAGIVRTLLSLVVLVLAVGSWLYAAVQLTGGWQAYQDATNAQSLLVLPTSSALFQGVNGARHNALVLVRFLDTAFGATALVALYGLGRFLTFKGLVADHRLRFLLLWFLPPVLVYVLVHIGDPGYVLSIVPILCLASAVALRDISYDLRSALILLSGQHTRLGSLSRVASGLGTATAVVIAAILVAWNVNAFVRTEGSTRWPEIRSVDTILSTQIQYAGQFSPGTVVILSKDRFRQFQYYLPGHNLRLLYDEFAPDFRLARYAYQIPRGVNTVLVMDFGRRPEQFPGATGAEVVLSSNPYQPSSLWRFEVKPGDTVEYGYDYLGVK